MVIERGVLYSTDFFDRFYIPDTPESRSEAIADGARLFTTTSFSRDPRDTSDSNELIYYGDLFLDFDKDGNLSLAQSEAQKVITYLVNSGVSPDAMLYFASGKKGFHVQIPAMLLGSEQGSPKLPLHYRAIAEELKESFAPTLDTGIYNMGQGKLLRIANVERTDKYGNLTGRYKIPLTYEEIMGLSAEEIDALCNSPQPEISLPELDDQKSMLGGFYERARTQVESSKNRAQRANPRQNRSQQQQVPPCIENLLTVTKESGLATNFNEIALRLSCYFKNSGLEEQVALEMAEPLLNNYHSSTYSTYDERKQHLGKVLSGVLKNPQSFFHCGTALSILKGKFSCESCSHGKITANDIQEFISAESNLDILETKAIELIGIADLKQREQKPLILFLASKLQTTEKDINSLLKEFKDKKSKLSESEVVKKVQNKIGANNYMSTEQGDYIWRGKGVWERVKSDTIRNEIRLCIPDALQKNTLINNCYGLLRIGNNVENTPFNESSEVITCLNGNLIFEDGEWQLTPFNRELYSTIQIPVEYDSTATCERFDSFLEEIFEGDEDKDDKKKLTFEIIGYCLLKTARFEKFAILQGPGANGKSVLLNVMENILGKSNISNVSPTNMDKPFSRASLLNKLANITTEIPIGLQLHDSTLKAVVSGDAISAEFKYESEFTFRPFSTVVFATNHMPSLLDYSNAVFRRTLILAFNRIFSESEQDKALNGKLKKETVGILNKALMAIGNVLMTGQFTTPKSMFEAIRDWKTSADHVRQFIEECCIVIDGEKEQTSDVFNEYKIFAINNGIKNTCKLANISRRIVDASDRRVSFDRNSQGSVLHGLKLNSSFGHVRA